MDLNFLEVQSRSLRILPRRSLSAEGKRHVKTALIRAQNSQHCNHPNTMFAKSSIQSMEELQLYLAQKKLHSIVRYKTTLQPACLMLVSTSISNHIHLTEGFQFFQDDKARVPIGLTAANKQRPKSINDAC